jgi:hypothetical protein
MGEVRKLIDEAVAVERERCAKIADRRVMDILERLQAAMHAESAYHAPRTTEAIEAMREAQAEIERLQAALRALHDWYVEYARINNLFNADGSPATFHELLEARRILELGP